MRSYDNVVHDGIRDVLDTYKERCCFVVGGNAVDRILSCNAMVDDTSYYDSICLRYGTV